MMMMMLGRHDATDEMEKSVAGASRSSHARLKMMIMTDSNWGNTVNPTMMTMMAMTSRWVLVWR
jgi:hypothetical protein